MRFLCALERINKHKPKQRGKEHICFSSANSSQGKGAAGAELIGMSQHLETLHLDHLVIQTKAFRETFESYTLNNVREIHIVQEPKLFQNLGCF